jgi:flagellar motor switch protein FliM
VKVSQVLSQEEIDALLKGIAEGDVATEPEQVEPAAESEVRLFDLASMARSKKEDLPTLQFVYDRFGKALTSALTLFIEREVEVNPGKIENTEYRELAKNLPLPTNMNLVTVESLKGFLILIFDAKLIFSVLETIFGGSRLSSPKVEGRDFTKIELKVVKKLMEVVLLELEKAWSPVYELRCKYSRSEMNPNYVTAIAPEEIVSLCDFSITVDDINSWMKVCVPYSILEPIKSLLIIAPSKEDQEIKQRWEKQLKGRLLKVPLELTATLGRKRMSLQEFVNLKEGSLILVDRHANDALPLEIDSRPRLKGKLGLFKGSKAIKIEQIIR